MPDENAPVFDPSSPAAYFFCAYCGQVLPKESLVFLGTGHTLAEAFDPIQNSRAAHRAVESGRLAGKSSAVVR